MYKSILASIAVSLFAASSAAQSVGSAVVVNNCTFQVSLWSVGSDVDGPYVLAAGGGSYSETFVKDPVTGGKALKVTTDPDGLYDGAPQTDYAYSLDGASIWYDLSDVFGDAFAGYELLVASAISTCPTIEWDSGTPPAGSQVKECSSAANVTFTICA